MLLDLNQRLPADLRRAGSNSLRQQRGAAGPRGQNPQMCTYLHTHTHMRFKLYNSDHHHRTHKNHVSEEAGDLTRKSLKHQ